MRQQQTVKISNIQDLFDMAGGAVKIAAYLKLHQYTVERWRLSGIPDKYHDSLCKKYGATPYELYSLSQKIRRKTRVQ